MVGSRAWAGFLVAIEVSRLRISLSLSLSHDISKALSAGSNDLSRLDWLATDYEGRKMLEGAGRIQETRYEI